MNRLFNRYSVLVRLAVAVLWVPVLLAADIQSVENKLDTIINQPFAGTTPEEFLVFVAEKGDALEKCADKMLAAPNTSAKNRALAYSNKELAICLKYGADSAQYCQKLEELVESLPDLPENRSLARRIIGDLIQTQQAPYYALRKEEYSTIADPFRKLIDRYAPLINKYFTDADGNEQTASILVAHAADSYDPSGKEGLVLYAAEKLAPVLDAHEKGGDRLLAYCARNAKAIARRIQMPGKELELHAADIDGNLYDIKDDRGKVVMIFTLSGEARAAKKLYKTLQDEPFVMLQNDDHLSPEVIKDTVAKSEIHWKILSRMAGYRYKDEPSVMASYGRDAHFVVDQNGRVVASGSRHALSEHCLALKEFFPQHATALEEIAAEIKAADDKFEENQAINQASYREDTTTTAGKIIALMTRLPMPTMAHVRLRATDFLLASESVSREKKFTAAIQKFDTLYSIASAKLQQDRKLRPEVAIQEMFDFVEEMQPLVKDSPQYAALLSNRIVSSLPMFVEYVSRADDPVDYAKEVIERYVRTVKHVDSYSLSLVDFLLNRLEDVDDEHQTMLVQSFLTRIIPVLAASDDVDVREYAKRLDGQLRRVSMAGSEFEFECVLINNEKINVKDLRGKVVLVNFWGTTCGPCLAEFPAMKEIYEKYKPQGYEMIAISGDTTDDINRFIEKTKYPWLFGSLSLSEKAGLMDYWTFYGIRGIPTTFLLDQSGIVRYMQVGTNDEQLRQEVEKLFEKPAVE
ncbi:MAG: TlpA family protein disulfide reductase [Thermoguttaceae bacterium]